MSFDGPAFGREIVAEVKRYLEQETSPLVKRIEQLEAELKVFQDSSVTAARRETDLSSSLAALQVAFKELPPVPTIPDIPALVAESINATMRTFSDDVDSRIGKVSPTDEAIKSIVDSALVTVLPKAIGEVLAGVDQRISAVMLERSAFVEMIDQAVGSVHEEIRDNEAEHVKQISAVSKQLDEVTAGFAESIGSLSDTSAKLSESIRTAIEEASQAIVGVDTEVAKRFDALEAQVSSLPVEAIAGKDGRGIEKITLSETGHLLVKLTDDDFVYDLGEVIGKDGLNGKDGQNGKDGTNGLDFDIDWAAGKISDEVHRAVGELPVPVSITDIRLIDGQLCFTMSDGKNYDIGRVVGTDGKDVDRVELGKWISTELDAMVAAIPVPKSIEAVQIATNGQLQIKMTGDSEFKSLGFIVGKDGVNGKDAAEVDIGQIIDKATSYIDEKIASIEIPEPVDIKSVYISDTGDLWVELGAGGHTNLGKVKADEVDLDAINAQIKSNVEEAVAAIPPAPAGKDAVIDQKLLKQVVFEEVALQVSELPKPADGKDGTGIKNAELQNDGMLVVVLDNDQMINVGRVKGSDGKDADMDAIQAIIVEKIAEMPVPENGKDGVGIKDLSIVDGNLQAVFTNDVVVEVGNVKGQDVDMGVVDELIRKEVAAIPRPQDGKSVTVEEVTPVLAELVSKAVAEIPVPRDGIDGKNGNDGVGLAGAFINRDGELIVTLTNGDPKQLGPVVGRDGKDVDMNVVAATIKQHVDSIPRPKDGLDGIGFDDMSVVYDDAAKEMVILAAKGENAKSWKFFLPMVIDKGVFKEGSEYLAGDGTTFGGSFWIAQTKTTDKPGTTDAWRLAVKKGRDGKDRPVEPKGPANSVKLGD